MSAKSYAAFLFDMDGTIIDSLASAERVWGRWAQRHGLDVAVFLPTIHGVRAVETILRQNIPGVDPEREAEWIARAETDDVSDVVPIEGARSFLAALPPHRWAIVTSASRDLALRRLDVAGIAPPAVFVTAEDVVVGKPAPDGYQLAANRLGHDPRDCLVFEDAIAGILAAEAAGTDVIIVGATHRHPMQSAHRMIDSYDELRVHVDEGGLHLVGTPLPILDQDPQGAQGR